MSIFLREKEQKKNKEVTYTVLPKLREKQINKNSEILAKKDEIDA